MEKYPTAEALPADPNIDSIGTNTGISIFVSIFKVQYLSCCPAIYTFSSAILQWQVCHRANTQKQPIIYTHIPTYGQFGITN